MKKLFAALALLALSSSSVASAAVVGTFGAFNVYTTEGSKSCGAAARFGNGTFAIFADAESKSLLYAVSSPNLRLVPGQKYAVMAYFDTRVVALVGEAKNTTSLMLDLGRPQDAVKILEGTNITFRDAKGQTIVALPVDTNLAGALQGVVACSTFLSQ